MLTKQNVLNLARMKLGLSPNSSETEADINTIYDISKQFLIESRYWTFAKKSQALVLTEDDSFPNWNYVYRLPDDLGKIFDVVPRYDYDIYLNYLVSNSSVATLVYSSTDIGDEYPSYFGKALAMLVAKDLSQIRTADKSLYQLLEQEYNQAYLEASSLDSSNVSPLRIQSNRYIDVR